MPSQVRDQGQKYCIIGAGPSGLSMAAELRRRAIPYDHFEKRAHIGGVWEIENPGSPMYQSAHLISSKTMSGFLDFPMPTTYPDYPRHDQVLAYLKAYARHHQLESQFTLATEVEEVIPEVSTDSAAEPAGVLVRVQGELRRYAGVVCASGCNWEPRHPTIPGDFTGEVRHVVSYKSAQEFTDKRVLIIGLGNSGADIACDAARAAKSAVVSVRRGYHFVPKHLFGIPADVFAHDGPRLPLWLEKPIFSWLLRLLVGDLGRYGMPRPDHALLDTHPIVNDQLLHHLRHGDVRIAGDVQSFCGPRVSFADGTSEEFDLVLFATGYTRRIPYLDAQYLDPGSWAASQFLTCFSRKFPQLYTLGFAEINGALFPIVSRLAILIAEIARLKRTDPERVQRFFAWVRHGHFDLTGGRKLVHSPRHDHYCDDHALSRAVHKAYAQLGLAWPKASAAQPLLLPSHSPGTA